MLFEQTGLKNLVTFNEFYTVRPAEKGVSPVEAALGVRLWNQSLYEVALLRAAEGAAPGFSSQLGFYLSPNDFEEKVFQEIYD